MLRVCGSILFLRPAASLLCGETCLAWRGRGGWLNQQHDDKPLDSIDGDLRCEAAALGLARE